jgi:hypothetical protein
VCPLRDLDGLNRDELGFELGLAILEQHAYNFLQVGVQLIERFALAVRTWRPRDMSDEQASVRVAFDDDIERSHASEYSTRSSGQGGTAGISQTTSHV